MDFYLDCGGVELELRVVQVTKEFYGARFNILDTYGKILGTVLFQGRFGSMEGTFVIRYGSISLELRPCRPKDAVRLGGEDVKRSPFRPYEVIGNDDYGIMFHDQIKVGFMREAGYHFLKMNDRKYYMYFVGFGEKGICAPVYRDENYIAEIEKPCLIQDSLHSFFINVLDESDLYSVLCLCCYTYVMTYYAAGEKVTKGIQRKVYTTKEKYLIEKCRNTRYRQEI